MEIKINKLYKKAKKGLKNVVLLKKRNLGQEAKPKPLHEQPLKSLSTAESTQENAKKDKFKWAKEKIKSF